MKKAMSLHDNVFSKKKLHEGRMLGGSIPPIHKMSEHQKQLDEEMQNDMPATHSETQFTVDVKAQLLWVIKLFREARDDVQIGQVLVFE